MRKTDPILLANASGEVSERTEEEGKERRGEMFCFLSFVSTEFRCSDVIASVYHLDMQRRTSPCHVEHSGSNICISTTLPSPMKER